MTIKVNVSRVKKFVANGADSFVLEDVEIAESPAKGRARARKLFAEGKGLIGYITANEVVEVTVP